MPQGARREQRRGECSRPDGHWRARTRRVSTVAGRRPPIARAAATSQGGTLARLAANTARLGCPGGAFIAHLSRPAPLPTFVAPCSLQGAQRDVH